jgi:hypothetical protein
MNYNTNTNSNCNNEFISTETLIESDELPVLRKSIIIPSKEGSYVFNRLTYDEDFLGDLITKSEYDKIISDASKIMGNALLKKKKNDIFKVSNTNKFICILCIVFLLAYVITLSTSKNSDDPKSLIFLSLFFIIGSLIMSIAQSLHNFYKPIRKYFTVDEIIKKDLDEYFDEINGAFYFSKVGDKFVYTGSIHFTFIPGEKKIICNIDKVNPNKNCQTQTVELIQKKEEKNLHDSHDYVDFNHDHDLDHEYKETEDYREKIIREHLSKDLIVPLEGTLAHGNFSIIKEVDEENENVNQKFNLDAEMKRPMHFRVKSNFSLGNKSISFSAKEIEKELNKNNS